MDQVIETPAPASVPTRSYGRKRKIPADDNASEDIPAQKMPTDSSLLPSAPIQKQADLNVHVNASPIQETISSPPPPTAMETTYDEQKKVRGGRAKRQNQHFNGSNISHELKTTTSNNNDILPSTFDATSADADHAEKMEGDDAVDDFEKPKVKLVISKKKGSIFKSRAIEGEAGESIKQKRHVYKHKWDDDLPEEEKGSAHDA